MVQSVVHTENPWAQKIYLVRHQAAGLLTEFPFARPPSEQQVAALAKLCFQRHGGTHPRTGEPYWLSLVEINTFGPDEVPSVPDRSLSVAQAAGVPQFEVSAKGTVSNPKEQ